MIASNRIGKYLALLLLLFLAACATRTDIREILADPRTDDGKTVTVEGEVSNTLSLFVIKYFEINDGTGVIRIVSSKPLPVKGQRLKVTGKVQQAFSLGDQSVTVLVEDDPKAVKQ
jgi:aspartyl/asparaginyl-tRNA synthetase